ncbi:hypothetical protein F6X51_12730 [Methylobacterium planeticum]|uniref:Tyrosine-type recombinase/integrase n=1 Tax=Methylobacterium planeticum TaxID=2615211 RepID=A0A6N6MPD3_9HYPH|nr:hypothetical protein F6X51_12730 [Methylobacterium planeticum]
MTVPCLAPLAEILDQRLEPATHLFRSSDGGPWTEGGRNAPFRKLRAKRAEAGKVKPGLTAHGLRHSVATDLRELGRTDREIADMLASASPTRRRPTIGRPTGRARTRGCCRTCTGPAVPAKWKNKWKNPPKRANRIELSV